MVSSNVKVLYFGSSKGIGLTEHLTEYAIGLKNNGMDIIVVYNGEEQRKGLIEKIQLNNIQSLNVKNIENWRLIFNCIFFAKVIDKEDVDIIQCQGIYHLIASRIARTISKKKPQIVTYAHAYVPPFANIILNRWSDLIFAVSNQTKKLLIEKGLDKNKIVVIYNTLNIDQIRKYEKGDFNKEYNEIFEIAEKYKCIIWASAHLSPKKGHTELLFAAKRVIDQFPDVYFILTGNGEFKKELIKIVDELEIKKNILFVGKIRYPALIKLMKHSYIGVVPSHVETFCHALIETMAVGKPVISTPVGIAEEIIVDGETGYITQIGNYEQLADKIIYLIQNESLVNHIGHNGMKLVETKFDINIVSKEILQIYRQLSEQN